MIVTNLTFNVALEITSNRFLLRDFYKYADKNQYIDFVHTDYLCTYPDFGKHWLNGKLCEFHCITTRCKICGYESDRNIGGYGSLYLLRSGDKNRMDLFCDDHISGTSFNPGLFARKQIALF